jgi:hypothetical protein
MAPSLVRTASVEGKLKRSCDVRKSADADSTTVAQWPARDQETGSDPAVRLSP